MCAHARARKLKAVCRQQHLPGCLLVQRNRQKRENPPKILRPRLVPAATCAPRPTRTPLCWSCTMCARISTRHCAINTWQIWSWVCPAREEGCSPASSVLSGEKNMSKVLKSVSGIRDILARIRIRWSIPLTNGSGSGFGSCYFCQWSLRCQLKIIFLTKFFSLLRTFENTLTSFSKIKSLKKVTKQEEWRFFLLV